MKTTTNPGTEIYNTIFSKCSKHVKNYREDLTEYDKTNIEKDHKTPFFHISRENGTALIRLFEATEYPGKGERVKFLFSQANRTVILNSNLETLLHYLERDPKTILFYDGSKLKKVTRQEAKNIFSAYKNRILNFWERQEIAKNLEVIF